VKHVSAQLQRHWLGLYVIQAVSKHMRPFTEQLRLNDLGHRWCVPSYMTGLYMTAIGGECTFIKGLSGGLFLTW